MAQKREKHASQRYALVELWLNSEEQRSDFCRKHDINVNTFNYWLGKYRKVNSFIELKTPEPSVCKSESLIQFSFSGGVSAEVPAELALQFMHQLKTK